MIKLPYSKGGCENEKEKILPRAERSTWHAVSAPSLVATIAIIITTTWSEMSGFRHRLGS